MNRGKEILRRGSPQSLEHDKTPGKWTGWESLVNEDSVTTPVLHHYQADLRDKETLWGSSSKQSMQPYVTQGK